MPPVAGTQSVWYLGASSVRVITDVQWAAAGFTGRPTTQWDSSNGWSLDANGFTDAQLTFLGSLSEFKTNGTPFGPRPSSTIIGPTPDTAVVTKGFLDASALKLGEAISAQKGDLFGSDGAGSTKLYETIIDRATKGDSTAQVVTTSLTDLNCTIVVPAQDKPWWLRTTAAWQITVAGAGGLYLVIYDITNVLSTFQVGSCPVSSNGTGFTNGAWSKFILSPLMGLPMEPTTQTTVYALYGQIVQDAGSSLAASVRHNSANPTLLEAAA